MDGVKTVYFSAFRKVKILDEELLKCYNTKYKLAYEIFDKITKGEIR